MKYLFVLLSFVIIGCSNINLAPNSQHIKTYYPNGNLMTDIVTVHNEKTGPIHNYFEDGRLAVKGTFLNGERDKKWTFYDENTGNIIAIENYKAGKLEGEQLYYYPDGKLKLKGNYKDNIRIGFWEMYDEEGDLEIQNIFLDGEYLVNVAIFQKNGNILCSGTTINGYREGLWNFFDENGKILYDVIYENGVKNGEWKAYSKEGEIIATGYFNNGVMLGLE